jgi:hypothetical protein
MPSFQPEEVFFKTQMCKDYIRTGFCEYGLACQYAHRLEQLASLDFAECDPCRNDKYKS